MKAIKISLSPMLSVLTALLLSLCCGLSCQQSDIGAECPQLLTSNNSVSGVDSGNYDGNANGNSPPSERLETAEVVGQDVSYPCDELLCVASSGRDGYCSKTCIVGSPTACPNGFECAVIQQSGAFANQGFCRWRSCETVKECGSSADFCCVLASSPNSQPRKLCAFKKGSCP